jgi:hypothetical protein
MPKQHCEDAIEHICNHDFPERESWMIQAWEQLGHTENSAKPILGYRDEFYIALELSI